jgi:hypothetical protein
MNPKGKQKRYDFSGSGSGILCKYFGGKWKIERKAENLVLR